MFRISLFKKINFGAVTGTCLVILSIIIVIVRVSIFDYKPLPLLKSSKSSIPPNYETEKAISIGSVQRKTIIGKDSISNNHNNNDSYLNLHTRRSNDKYLEYNSSDKKFIQNKDTIYNEIDGQIIKDQQSNTILSDLAIARLIVAAYITEYSSMCACPYQRTPTGKSCINKITYVRGSGQICYVTDVSPKMIQKYRNAH